jgi:hypothetical protein
MDGPAPAIVNAVEDALAVHFDSIPLLPEDIMNGLNEDGLNRDGLTITTENSGVGSARGVR